MTERFPRSRRGLAGRLRTVILPVMAAAGLVLSGQAGAQDQPAASPAAGTSESPPADNPKTAAPNSVTATASAASDAQVEGYLFFAANDPAAPAQEEKVAAEAGVVSALEARLKKVFPYAHYHLIGRHTQKVFREYESWVVPSKDLCLKLDSRGPAEGGGVNLHLQLWQDTKVLVKSDTVLRQDKPIFLGGPDWRGGRLIFVVRLK